MKKPRVAGAAKRQHAPATKDGFSLKGSNSMLVLSRRHSEKLIIGSGANEVILSIERISGNRVTLGIIADPSVPVVRGELEKFDGAARPHRTPGVKPTKAAPGYRPGRVS